MALLGDSIIKKLNVLEGITGTPIGETWVAGITPGKALLTSTATSFGAVFNAPTKDYRVGLSTYPGSDNKVYLSSITNANVTAGTNTVNKQLTWEAGTGILTATGFSGPLTGNADTATAISSSTFTAASATNEERPVWISWTSSAKNKPCYTTGFTYNVSTTTLSVPKIKIGTADLGTDTKPIKLVAGVPTAVGADLAPANHTHTMSAISDLPGIVNNTAQGNLGWTASTSAHDKSLATVNTIAYWNGAYQGTTSNLAYCNKGAFGDVVTHAASEFADAGHALSLGTTSGSGNIVKAIGVSGHTVTMTKMTESDLINNLSEGTSPANRNDYIVAQYAAGGTTTKTYHRRKLAQIFAALDSSDITTALGFTPLPSTGTAADSSKLGGVVAANYALKSDITGVYKYKGSVAALANLPASGNTTGDIYDVQATGMNYAWNGSAWDSLGQLITSIPWSSVTDKPNVVTYTNNTVSVVGNSKTVSKTTPDVLYVANGLIMGGTAQAAGLVTRGICGVNTPGSTGGCTKENLFVNYDGDNTYRSDRQLVLQAGDVGTHYGNNLYQFTAARGDAVKGYCDATYAAKATTLAGYNISDAKIASGTITLGTDSITPLTANSTLNAAKLSGTIPASCYTNTTYAAGTGLSLSGTTINHSNSVTAGTAGQSTDTSGSTLAVPYVTYDTQGHITATGTHTHTITGFSTTDTKNTAGSTDTSSKIFLVGATSQAASAQTYSDNEIYATNGVLTTKSVQVGGTACTLQYNSTNQCLDFVFA